MIYFLLVLGLIIDIIFVIHDHKAHDGFSIVLKTLASLSFVVISFYVYLKYKSEYGILIILALIFDTLGDFVLILRNIYYKHKDLIYVLGTLSFLIGHIFLLVLLNKIVKRAIILSILITTILFIFSFFTIIKKHIKDNKSLVVASIYIYFILYILIVSILAIIKVRSIFLLIFLVGYFLFVLSDYILIIHKFSLVDRYYLQPLYRITYFVSQLILTLSLYKL